MRNLQQKGNTEDIVQVTTPQQLLDSVLEGSMYTEVLEHLDLTTVQPTITSDFTAMMYTQRRHVGQSIKVRPVYSYQVCGYSVSGERMAFRLTCVLHWECTRLH